MRLRTTDVAWDDEGGVPRIDICCDGLEKPDKVVAHDAGYDDHVVLGVVKDRPEDLFDFVDIVVGRLVDDAGMDVGCFC